jgi:hypothetical protein
MLDFREYISNLSLEQLHEYQKILSSVIENRNNPISFCPTTLGESFTGDWDIKYYVTYKENFLCSITDISKLLGDCLSMGFKQNHCKNSAVQNKFVSPFFEPYSSNSGSRSIINNPLDLSI